MCHRQPKIDELTPEEILSKINEHDTPDSWAQIPRVLFYPSSGYGSDGLTGSIDIWKDFPDVDVFILSDYEPSEQDTKADWFKSYGGSRSNIVKSTSNCMVSRRKNRWFFFFFEDNNKVFDKVKKAGLPISYYVGINDGCREGGNYECVNSEGWLEKVFNIFPSKQRGIYVTDHSPVVYPSSHLNWPNPPEPHDEIVYDRWNLERSHRTSKLRSLTSGTYGRILSYRVSKHNNSVWRRDSQTGVDITLEHDNIAHHCEELDGAVISRRCCDQVEHLSDSVPRKRVVRGWRSNTEDCSYFTRSIFRWANRHELPTVGTIPYGQGEHTDILESADSWNKEYPDSLRIFFFDSGDFQDIKPEFRLAD